MTIRQTNLYTKGLEDIECGAHAPSLLTAGGRLVLSTTRPAGLLAPLVPPGTTLTRGGAASSAFVSSFATPGSRLHLASPLRKSTRFVRRNRSDGTVVRAVVFIRELARSGRSQPRSGVYNEPYLALPMAHRLTLDAGRRPRRIQLALPGCGVVLSATATGPPRPFKQNPQPSL